MKNAYLLAFACGALTLGVTASAHHSFAATYLINEEQTVEGTLVAFLYRNPHAFLHLNVTDESGETVRWAVEWGGATSLTGQNVTRDTLKPGDQVVGTVRSTTLVLGALPDHNSARNVLALAAFAPPNIPTSTLDSV